MSLENKTILLTGGAGSFGQEFVRIVIKEHNPKSIRVYDHDELKCVEMERSFPDSRIRFLVGDVRDKDRLYRAMNGVDIVVHAAALKHVPICEYNPIEAIKTNIDGTALVIDAVIDNNVKKAILISTDKAVHPVNLYGATKMVAEKLFVQGNSYIGERDIKMSCVRYGNVIASNGSVIPLFKEQKKTGEITITDERMTRFWITLEQGVQFVIQSIGKMEGGEIFIPKIPSMKITDLAEVMAPDIKRNIVGIRPGEKLHEELITAQEAVHTKDIGTYFVIEPELPFWGKENYKDGKQLPSDFAYTSHNNDVWITKEQLQEIIKDK